MSPSTPSAGGGRRWLGTVVRVAVTALAVAWVFHLIQFHDTVRIGPKGSAVVKRRPEEVREVRREGELALVTFADGRVESHPKSDVEELPGFLSLFERTHKGLFIAMVASLLIPFFFLALRWWLLLRGNGFDAAFGQIFFVTYAGTFFNNFLPGSVGGDLTKAILASSGEERKAAVAGTVILDRAVGLAVMIVLGAVCMTPYVSKFKDPRLAWLIYGLFVALIAGYFLYFSPPIRALLRRLPFRDTVEELDGVFRMTRDQKPLVAKASVLAFCAQASGILIIYGLARAMGMPGVSLWMFFIFEPVIFIVTALPISMGGWGVQESIYEQMFSGFGGVDRNYAIALSVLYKLSLILVSIPGGILFALGAARRRRAGSAPGA